MKYRERSFEEEKAIEKNIDLVYQLLEKRGNFALIGTNKVKRRLNKISDRIPEALALRYALEVEDKKYFGEWRDKIYQEKSNLISTLIFLSEENGWVYGIQNSDVSNTTHIIYFEFPNCEQISWHYSPSDVSSLPKYTKKWDGKINSTLDKLEKAIIVLLKEHKLINEKDLK